MVDPEKSRTLIGIGDTSLPIAISEHVARTKHEVTAAEQKAIERWRRSPNRWGAGYHYPSPPDYDYHPTGKLTISIGSILQEVGVIPLRPRWSKGCTRLLPVLWT